VRVRNWETGAFEHGKGWLEWERPQYYIANTQNDSAEASNMLATHTFINVSFPLYRFFHHTSM
jgi:hypothetical protein